MALGRSPEYHWNQIISKSVNLSSGLAEEVVYSFFLFVALVAILFNRVERFEQFLF